MNTPVYYTKNGLSPIEAMEKGLISHEEYIGFIKGNILKYIVRADYKEDCVSDLLKAKNYLELLINLKKDMIDDD